MTAARYALGTFIALFVATIDAAGCAYVGVPDTFRVPLVVGGALLGFMCAMPERRAA